MAVSLLQWNCRGVRCNYDDICTLLEEHQPHLFCLQETLLNNTHKNLFKHYNVFRKDRVGGTGGGVAIIANSGVIVKELILNTPLEAVAVRAQLQCLTTVVSVYLPPNSCPSVNDLVDLVNQLPKPFLILGDMNAHHALWGSDKTNSHGKRIEQLMNTTNITILNTGDPTHFNTANRSYSSIDLSIASPGLSLKYSWDVIQNLFGSDHFPIQLRTGTSNPTLSVRHPRWNLEAADWNLFKEHAIIDHEDLAHLPIDEENAMVTQIIINAASKSIPRSTGRLPKRPKPWWNNECRQMRKAQNKAWQVLKRYPTITNLITFKKIKAKGRYVRRKAKDESWKNFVSEVNSRTSAKLVWGKIRKMDGENRAFTIPLLSRNDARSTSLKDQADILGEHFYKVSSSAGYTDKFLKHKKKAEHKKLPHPNTTEEYNCDFTLYELELVLANCKATAVGPDEIHYSMLRNLPISSLESLLTFFNRIWNEGKMPDDWKTAIVIPILKPGKDRCRAESYRPITLTSCLCKTFERLVNTRLVYILEMNRTIDRFQCGFRHDRSSVDLLVRLETQIREAHAHGQYCLSVFFDLEKAYDTTWRYGILQDLVNSGISGNMLYCIKDFLSFRTFRVRLGDSLSDVFIQENGVPQGSVLSVTLFSLKINSLTRVIPPSVQYSLYVDDLQISFTSCNFAVCERQVQTTVSRLTKWADENGFKFSPDKTVCVCFTRKRGLLPQPSLNLNGKTIPVKTEQKFLGLVLDSKLTFGPHIKHLKLRAQKATNILKVLSHKTWGADRVCLLRLYRSIIRSKMDYGCIVYGSARPSTLKALDPVHNLGLRLSTGAYRTSPINSLYVECNEPSLADRRTTLTCSYVLKIRSIRKHICYPIVTTCPSRTLFANKPQAIRPLFLRFEDICERLDIKDTLPDVAHKPNPLAPWYRLPSVCDFTLTQFQKNLTPHDLILQEYLALNEKYRLYTAFYTDGSKSADCVGSAVVQNNWEKTIRLPNCASIFTAECYAVSVAVKKIISENIENSIVYTDSLSVLTALHPRNASQPLVGDIIHNITRATKKGHDIKFCWVPSHVGISGNEKADECAAKAQHKEIKRVKIPYKDCMKLVQRELKVNWQSAWNNEENNKLHLVRPTIEEWKSCSHQERFMEVILCRLRIGHTHLTHSFLLTKQDKPHCKCGDEMNVNHILFTCSELETLRKKYFTPFYIDHIPFHPALILGEHPLVNISCVFSFLREAGFLKHL